MWGHGGRSGKDVGASAFEDDIIARLNRDPFAEAIGEDIGDGGGRLHRGDADFGDGFAVANDEHDAILDGALFVADVQDDEIPAGVDGDNAASGAFTHEAEFAAFLVDFEDGDFIVGDFNLFGQGVIHGSGLREFGGEFDDRGFKFVDGAGEFSDIDFASFWGGQEFFQLLVEGFDFLGFGLELSGEVIFGFFEVIVHALEGRDFLILFFDLQIGGGEFLRTEFEIFFSLAEFGFGGAEGVACFK